MCFGASCWAFFEQRSSALSSSCQHRHAPKTIYSLPRPPNCPSGCNSQPTAPYCHSPTGRPRPASRPTGRQTEPGVIPVCGGACQPFAPIQVKAIGGTSILKLTYALGRYTMRYIPLGICCASAISKTVARRLFRTVDAQQEMRTRQWNNIGSLSV